MLKILKELFYIFGDMTLKTIIISIFLSLTISPIIAQQLCDLVNPMVGTGGTGHTFPGASMPFGMVQLSPDTRIDNSWEGCSGYAYTDSIIYGFTHTHLSGTGCSDYGDILLMPTNKKIIPNAKNYASTFNHNLEKATPGNYSVFLNKPKIQVELAASTRAGIHKYTYQKKDEQFLVLDLQHRDEVIESELEIVYPNAVKGYRFSKAWATNQKVFFYITFNKPFSEIFIYDNDTLNKHPYVKSKNLKALFNFSNVNDILITTCGISGVSAEGAMLNAEKEIPNFNFNAASKKATETWELALNKIKINDGTSTQKNNFYTALYHSMLSPNMYSDVNNKYRGRDDKIHSTDGKFDYYTVFSLWDTYRALHPLLNIIEPKRTNDFVQTFIKQFEQGGRLPIWELSSNETNCMIGYHVASVITDAYKKGIKNYDIKKALEAMISIANENTEGLNSYKKNGYVSADDDAESVSKTLEYAYDDYCISNFCDAVLHDINDNDTSLLKYKNDTLFLTQLNETKNAFAIRANNWQNIYDPTTGFMRARANSTLVEPFSAYMVDNNFTEANSWQYSFSITQSIAEYIKMIGGKDNFEKKLDDLFNAKSQTEGRDQADITGLIGQYAHGNEPSHHIAYLYKYTNHPEKANEKVAFILNNFYKNEPDGLIGNEDCGQMSAWYVLSAMGIYPIDITNSFVSIPPQFKYANIKNGAKQIEMQIDKNGLAICNDNSIKIDNNINLISKPIINNLLPTPFLETASQVMIDSLLITMHSYPKNAKIFYTINNTNPRMYVGSFYIHEKCSIQFYSALDTLRSADQQSYFYKLPKDIKISTKSIYNKQYNGGNDNALIDGLHGSTNWRKGKWQGFQAQDFETIITLANPKKIKSISAIFLQDQRSWIFFPTTVTYATSMDGKIWNTLNPIDVTVPRQDAYNEILPLPAIVNDTIKYIKIVAKNYGKLPSWHPGAGGDAFIFIDEVEIAE
jgi:predicted alpha-1,2-mannosidase